MYFPIRFADFLFGKLRILQVGFSISMIFIFNEFLMDLLKNHRKKSPLIISNGNGIFTSLSEEIIIPLPRGK